MANAKVRGTREWYQWSDGWVQDNMEQQVCQQGDTTLHIQDRCGQVCAGCCLQDMNIVAPLGRLECYYTLHCVPGVRLHNKIKENKINTLAAENKEHGDHFTTWNTNKPCTVNLAEKLQLLWTHLEDNRLVEDVVFGIMAGQTRRGRHQRMAPDRHAHSAGRWRTKYSRWY